MSIGGGASMSGDLPVPDPTVLTTAALTREIENLRDLFNARMDSMDQATAILTSTLGRYREDAAAAAKIDVEHLKELTEQRATAQEALAAERVLRMDERKEGTDRALAAALAAAKEAVEKTEVSTFKQIDAIRLLIDNAVVGINDKIDDVKSRFERGEGIDTGISRAAVFSDRNRSALIGLAAVLVAAAGVVVTVLIATGH